MKKTSRKAPDETHLRLFYCRDARETRGVPEAQGRIVQLSHEEARHATRVLRLGCGDRVRLFDGAGWFYEGVIANAGREDVSVEIRSSSESDSEPATHLTLMVGLLKGRKADLLIQKSVELGVGELLFFSAERSVSRLRNAARETGKTDRWDQIVVSACKQCGRASLMPVRACHSLEEALAILPEQSERFAFWEAEARDESERESGPRPVSLPLAFPHGVCALIGPEGGFTPEEIEQVRTAGFRTCSLGPRILRAETAALAAAAILLHAAGDLGTLAKFAPE